MFFTVVIHCTPAAPGAAHSGHDATNREVFLAEDADNLNLVRLAIHEPKNRSIKR
jgi:hypothetical protein